MKLIRNKLNDKKGFLSIFTILILSAIIPLSLFIAIDLPYFVQMNRKVKNILDNSTSAGITQINPANITEINSDKAIKLATDVFISGFKLNEDLTPNSESIIKSAPELHMEMIKPSPYDITNIKTSKGLYKIEEPSLVANVKVEVKGKVFKMLKVNILKTSISQVTSKE